MIRQTLASQILAYIIDVLMTKIYPLQNFFRQILLIQQFAKHLPCQTFPPYSILIMHLAYSFTCIFIYLSAYVFIYN